MERYRGKCARVIRCSNFDDLLKVVDEGGWFRTKSFDFYYNAVPFAIAGGYEAEKNVACLRSVCVTSVTTKWKYFYRLEKVDDPEVRIFAGKDLEDLICKELTKWVLNLNPKTLKAFGGKSFTSYLNAIPSDIFFKPGFDKRMKNALQKGFVKRISSGKFDSVEGMDEINALAEKSVELLEESAKKREDKLGLTDSAKNNQVSDALRQQKIEELKKIFNK